jgi:hypothetical protein
VYICIYIYIHIKNRNTCFFVSLSLYAFISYICWYNHINIFVCMYTYDVSVKYRYWRYWCSFFTDAKLMATGAPWWSLWEKISHYIAFAFVIVLENFPITALWTLLWLQLPCLRYANDFVSHRFIRTLWAFLFVFFFAMWKHVHPNWGGML